MSRPQSHRTGKSIVMEVSSFDRRIVGLTRMSLGLMLGGLLLASCAGVAAPPPSKPALPGDTAAAPPPDAQQAARRDRVMALGDAKDADSQGPKTRSFDVLAATALKGCGPKEWPAYMASLPTVRPDESPGEEPIEMFALPPLVRYLYQFGNCMSAEQKQQLLSGLTSKQKLTAGGTSNHAVMRATSWYLLAQYFPNAQWTDWNGKQVSSPQLMATLKARLAARTARIYKSGLDEWLSPTYAPINFYTMLNLVDFAADPSVRAAAVDEATLQVSVLHANSFHGVLVPPLTRKNYEQRNAPEKPGTYIPSPTQLMLWYYFGEPQMSDYDLQSRKQPYFLSMLALSKWLPPAPAQALGTTAGQAYAMRLVTPDFGDWGQPTPPAIYGSSFISDDFAIGTGNLVFDPSWYNDHTQTFAILLKSRDPQNAIECYQPYWDSNKGEDGWNTDRSSPFQQMYRYDESSVVMLFDIPQRDPWVYDRSNRFFAQRDSHAGSILQMFECRIPRSFQQVVTENNWVFAKQGEVFVAIATLQGANEYDKVPAALGATYRVFKVREPKSALFFRVERARSDLSFEQFQKQVRANVPTYDRATSTVSLTEADGTKTRVSFSLRQQAGTKYWASLPVVSRNGQDVPYATEGTVDSPALTLKAGVLDLKSKGQTLRIAPQSTQ